MARKDKNILQRDFERLDTWLWEWAAPAVIALSVVWLLIMAITGIAAYGEGFPHIWYDVSSCETMEGHFCDDRLILADQFCDDLADRGWSYQRCMQEQIGVLVS